MSLRIVVDMNLSVEWIPVQQKGRKMFLSEMVN
jgi:hypothetical protein